ncbi:type I restriction endonuclease subunit R [Gracilimonas halophila]|uniref:Type I restriction enzyme endonuclease subunit n=1 Tax=Gracilimonas halophila TaxID=1834464 RepID=A0ABW5JLP3_9BACT
MNETQLEEIGLQWFSENGWQVVHGPDIAPDSDTPQRASYSQVLMEQPLREAIQRINPHLKREEVDEVIHKLRTITHPILVKRNKLFHSMLLDGVTIEIERDGKREPEPVRIVDFGNAENNNFQVVNQFTIQGTKQPRRPDVVAFINGIPVAVIELKNPDNEDTDIYSAFNQIQTYKDEIPDLFAYNVANIISDGYNARVGSLTANTEWYMPWRAIKNEDDRPKLEFELETVIKGFFNPELFLDYIRHFILFEQDGDHAIKKIAGYHQFHAVREAVKAVITASRAPEGRVEEQPRATYGDEVEPGSKKGGVIWHTQGSGKSISMVCFAGKLLQQPEMKNPTILVVTDRNDLDGQLFQTFSSAQDLLKQTPIQADSRDDLREQLSSRESGGIYFTTVQKFSTIGDEKRHPALSERHNLVVISDEAHRSQYGLKAQYDTKEQKYKYGYARHMRDALPNATFIGFTGTPVSMEDRDTRAVFGDYVSIYDIQDAVDDGATVPIYYESRLAKLDVNRAEIDELSDRVEEVVEEYEDESEREKTKSEWSTLAKLVGATPRITQVADDLVKHFEKRTAAIDGKAMVVGMSREICVDLYNAITEIRPEWHYEDPEKGQIKIIMTGSAADPAKMQPHIYPKKVKKRLEKRFKDPADEFKVVIVCDMWLTGFDAPSCHTMYIDKPMRGHNLMQAIARVNRVFRDKQGGLVVDYIGIANELKQALKTYTDSKGKGSPTLGAQQAYEILLEKLHIIRGMLHEFDYSGYETEAHNLVIPAANHVLELENGKKRFLDAVLSLNKAHSLCNTLDEVIELEKEIAFFNSIKAAINKFTAVERKRSEREKNSILKQILDNAVVAEGVEDVFSMAGLENPEIGLLSDEFLEDVRRMKYKNLAVELLEKLLKDEIRSRTKNNVVQQKKFSERLLETLRKYHNRAIETAQVIEELIEMAKDFKKAIKEEDALGLNKDEVAFYYALAENESAVREMGDEILKKIAVEITEKLRNSTTVDWQKRESVRAKLRILVRRTLRRYKYPPDEQKRAMELVMEQAEALADEWSK